MKNVCREDFFLDFRNLRTLRANEIILFISIYFQLFLTGLYECIYIFYVFIRDIFFTAHIISL